MRKKERQTAYERLSDSEQLPGENHLKNKQKQQKMANFT